MAIVYKQIDFEDFINVFFVKFRVVLNGRYPKKTKGSLLCFPFKIVENKNSYFAEIMGLQKRFTVIFTMGEWLHKIALANCPKNTIEALLLELKKEREIQRAKERHKREKYGKVDGRLLRSP